MSKKFAFEPNSNNQSSNKLIGKCGFSYSILSLFSQEIKFTKIGVFRGKNEQKKAIFNKKKRQNRRQNVRF